jgi:GAF domain-containing protein
MILTEDNFGVRRRERLADIARLGLDRQAGRGYLQSIVDDAATRMDTPFATIDVLLDHAQIFLGTHGPVPPWIAEAGGIPVEWSFCLPLVPGRAARAVADLSKDTMFSSNPLVTVGGVRAYAGAPLISSRGQVLGGLCCLDSEPRDFADGELSHLQKLADEAVSRIEERA